MYIFSETASSTKRRHLDAEEIRERLEFQMHQKKRFVDAALTIDLLAMDIGYSRTALSKHINQHQCRNFNQYLNYYRITEFLRLYRVNQKKLTIETIAQMSGFRNRSTFYKSFRREMGVNPVDYLNRKI